MPMKNPPHPGGVVLDECIQPLGLTITEAAQALGGKRLLLEMKSGDLLRCAAERGRDGSCSVRAPYPSWSRLPW